MSKLFRLILIVIFIIGPSSVKSTNSLTLDGEEDDKYIELPDELPQPIGGIKSIYEKIVYPDKAKKAGIEGKVYLLVFINEEGKVDKIEILKRLGFGCEESVIEAIKATPFKPGFLYGKPVKSKLSLRFEFKLKI